MPRLLRVLAQYPGVGNPNDIISESEVTGNPQALVDAGIAEWVDRADRSAHIETTESAPVRETTSVRTGPRTGPRTNQRRSVGGESAV